MSRGLGDVYKRQVKTMNAAGERFGHKEEKEPDTKECPYCKSKIAIA